MRKISGHVVSTKASTLSRAAAIVSRFAAVDNGSSPAVSLYLQRTADAFNHLVRFHDKRSKLRKLESSPNLLVNTAEKSIDGNEGKDSESKARKKEKKTSDNLGETDVKGDEVLEIKVRKKNKTFDNLGETNLKGDEVEDVEISVKKKKKRKSDMKEKSSKKKKSKEVVDS